MYNEKSKTEAAVATEKRRLSFNATEAYKTVRLNIVFMLSQSERKSFVVSSTEVGEGKSTTASNLARTFAQMGNRVLLVDADLRKPTLHRKLRLSNTKGLSSVLVGFCSADEAIQTVEKNLDVITSGPIPPNQTELLCGTAMKVLARGLEERYDYIIYDAPPIGVVSDALVLAPLTAGVVMVVKPGAMTVEGINRTKCMIESVGARLLGAVLNGIKPSKTSRKYKRSYRNSGYYTQYEAK